MCVMEGRTVHRVKMKRTVPIFASLDISLHQQVTVSPPATLLTAPAPPSTSSVSQEAVSPALLYVTDTVIVQTTQMKISVLILLLTLFLGTIQI